MPVPAFGFSAGDFLVAIGLIKKISKALKKTGGAASEFQNAVIELKSLKRVLRHLEALEPTPENENHINAIRGMALACQLPLRDFLVKLEKYEAKLGPYSDQRWYRGFQQKSKWAIAFGEDVEKMRAVVASKTVSINLLLTLSISKSLTESNSRLRQEMNKGTAQILSKAVEHGVTLEAANDRLARIDRRLEQSDRNLDGKIDRLSSMMQTTDNIVVSLKSIGQQLVDFVRAFPVELRDMLGKILQSNWRTYQLLLSLQQSLGSSPTNLLDSNIRFEDALGEFKELPYEYFRHWETFEGFLRGHFKCKPGESKVSHGQYLVLDENRDQAVIQKENWTRSIDPGARISMSMIMSHLKRIQGHCPRPSCIGKSFSRCERAGLLKCDSCNLKFFLTEHSLTQIFDHVALEDEETLILKQQQEEDLQIYGDRAHPSDDTEVDEEDQLSRLLPKIDRADFQATVEGEKKKRDSRSSSNHEVTAMDWNAGESPISAWLNQSAIPASPLMTDSPRSIYRDAENVEQENLNEERKEVEIFKNIEVENEEEPQDASNPSPAQHRIADLELGTHVFYQNIMEKYPKLPHYLIARLAVANRERSRNLQNQREKATCEVRSEIANAQNPHLRDRQKLSLSSPSSGMLLPGPSSPADLFWQFHAKLTGRKTHLGKREASDQGRRQPDKPKKRRKELDHRDAERQSTRPDLNFWTKRPSVSRSRSRASQSSDTNSQLHWTQAVDTTYQSSESSAGNGRRSSVGSQSSRGLFVAPVQWHDANVSEESKGQLSFDCEICGKTIHVKRRRDWQKHVLKDLRPYICTYENCEQSEQQYETVKKLLRHMIQKHELDNVHHTEGDIKRRRKASIQCLFCGEQTVEGLGMASRGPHMGSHMEEIAFTVVPKAYEDWDFYSDSSAIGDFSTSGSEKVKEFETPKAHLRDRLPCKPASFFRALFHVSDSPDRTVLQDVYHCGFCGQSFLLYSDNLSWLPSASRFCFWKARDHLVDNHEWHGSFLCCGHVSTHKFREHIRSRHAGVIGPWTSLLHQTCLDSLGVSRLGGRIEADINDSAYDQKDFWKSPFFGLKCNRAFTCEADLYRHEQIVRAKQLSCPFCASEQQFSERTDLRRHLEACHPHIDFHEMHETIRLNLNRRSGRLECSHIVSEEPDQSESTSSTSSVLDLSDNVQ